MVRGDLLGVRLCGVFAMLVVCGCSRLHTPPEGDAGLFESGAPDPFAPVAVEISQLTRVERWSSGEPVLAVYLRMVDAWGDGTKAPARFNVQLFRVRGTSGLAERDDAWTWQIDLRDPDQNSGWFDATGLYRLPLSGVPGWVLEPERSDEVMRITVIASVMGREGEVVAPRDTINKVVRRWDGQ